MRLLFDLNGVSVCYGTAEILQSASLRLHAGELVAIAGPNGAGKSTLLSVVAGLVRPTDGTCLFNGRPVHEWPRRAFSQRVAVVLQSEPLAFPFTVLEVVAMGRMPHLDSYFESPADHKAIESALAQVEVDHLRYRDFRTLSGGEKQRVLLASALAQEPEVLLLDEPASHLDLEHQVALHELLARLRSSGLLVVAITHDLNLALSYADRLILVHKGQIRADGTPARILHADTVRDVFQVRADLQQTPAGRAWLSFGPLHD